MMTYNNAFATVVVSFAEEREAAEVRPNLKN